MPDHARKEVEMCLGFILNHIEESIQVVNNEGIVIYYNKVAAETDNLHYSEVIGKHILQVYPSLTLESSSLMQVLRTGHSVLNQQQTIVISSGKVVTIIYSTFPLYNNDVLIGACDISRDITTIKELSERVVELHSELLDTKASTRRKAKSFEVPHSARYTFNDIVGNDESIIKLKVLGQRIAASASPILVIGETGTGKELLVQSIHNASARRNGPFVAQNCAALPATLLESILFGTVKGSFTGAEDRLGMFELAEGGTLFLDEINSMPIDSQGKLLRVLEDGTLHRIGDTRLRKINTRVIACTNVEPEEAVHNRELRMDLYYRLNVVSLRVPSLREHMNDISVLTDHFIRMYNRKLNCHVYGISEETRRAFFDYSWPGNVRELQHAIEHAMNIISGSIIELEHLPTQLIQWEEAKIKEESLLSFGGGSLPEILNRIEEKHLSFAMKNCGGNISKAAAQLGVPRQTLQNKLKTYGLSHAVGNKSTRSCEQRN